MLGHSAEHIKCAGADKRCHYVRAVIRAGNTSRPVPTRILKTEAALMNRQMTRNRERRMFIGLAHMVGSCLGRTGLGELHSSCLKTSLKTNKGGPSRLEPIFSKNLWHWWVRFSLLQQRSLGIFGMLPGLGLKGIYNFVCLFKEVWYFFSTVKLLGSQES